MTSRASLNFPARSMTKYEVWQPTPKQIHTHLASTPSPQTSTPGIFQAWIRTYDTIRGRSIQKSSSALPTESHSRTVFIRRASRDLIESNIPCGRRRAEDMSTWIRRRPAELFLGRPLITECFLSRLITISPRIIKMTRLRGSILLFSWNGVGILRLICIRARSIRNRWSECCISWRRLEIWEDDCRV